MSFPAIDLALRGGPPDEHGRPTGWPLSKHAEIADAPIRLVLLCLADHANDELEAWPSVERIRLQTNIKRGRIVNRALAALQQDGVIAVVREGGGRANSTRYRLFPNRNPVAGDRVSDANPVVGDTVSGRETLSPAAQTLSPTAQTLSPATPNPPEPPEPTALVVEEESNGTGPALPVPAVATAETKQRRSTFLAEVESLIGASLNRYDRRLDAVDAHLEHWDPGELAQAATGDWPSKVRSTTAMLLSRLEGVPVEPEVSRSATPASEPAPTEDVPSGAHLVAGDLAMHIRDVLFPDGDVDMFAALFGVWCNECDPMADKLVGQLKKNPFMADYMTRKQFEECQMHRLRKTAETILEFNRDCPHGNPRMAAAMHDYSAYIREERLEEDEVSYREFRRMQSLGSFLDDLTGGALPISDYEEIARAS